MTAPESLEFQLRAERSANAYLHRVVTAQCVAIDELIEAMAAGQCTVLPTVAQSTSTGGVGQGGAS
ncbi:hypothetical protein PJN91_17185 [Mycobacterium kansasii]